MQFRAVRILSERDIGAEGRVVGDSFMENEDAVKKKFEVMGYLQGKVGDESLAASAFAN